MRSIVTSGHRPASWHRYRRVRSVSEVPARTVRARESRRRPEHPGLCVYYRYSILLHCQSLYQESAFRSNSLHNRLPPMIVHAVKFLDIAASENPDTMGQGCKGGVVPSDGCAWTLRKEGAHARS
jgi:hypothetical protein